MVSRDVRLERADGGPSSKPLLGPPTLEVIPPAALPNGWIEPCRDAENESHGICKERLSGSSS